MARVQPFPRVHRSSRSNQLLRDSLEPAAQRVSPFITGETGHDSARTCCWGGDGSSGEGLTPRRRCTSSHHTLKERLNLRMGRLLFGFGNDSIKCVVFLRTCSNRLRAKRVSLNKTQPEWRRVECPVCIFAAAVNVFQIVLLMVIFRGELY